MATKEKRMRADRFWEARVVGNRIEELRSQMIDPATGRPISLERLGESAGMSERQVCRLKTNENCGSLEMCAQLAQAFGVPMVDSYDADGKLVPGLFKLKIVQRTGVPDKTRKPLTAA